MNIAILSKGASLYSTQSLIKAGEAQNHRMEVLDPGYCNVMIKNNKALLQYHDEILDDIDAIIPRIGTSNTFYGASLVRHFEATGVFSIVSAKGIITSRDKWTCFQELIKAKIPMPKTTLASPSYVADFLKDFGEGKVIIKLLEGTHGQGVILCENYNNALSTVETLQTAGIKFIMQEFIEESNGEDLRAIVVDGQVVASMKRKSKDGDFRSNLHRGGSSSSIQLSNEAKQIAINASQILDLSVCGVDILQSQKGPLLLEVNSTPGLEGIEKTTGVDVAGKIIRYIEKNKA